VLSRCQRFDLRRVDIPTLSAHFSSICEKEGFEIEEAAVGMIARAADGSVRDGLSILDQAMALSSDKISAQSVEDMLGLADRARNMDLLEHALSGNMPEALEIMDDLYRNGSDAFVMMQDLLDLTHTLTKFRVVPEAKDSKQSMTGDQVSRAVALAAQLSMPTLAKTWQILLKGLSEVQSAPNPQSAAEMVLIRLAYAADLPDPADLMKTLKDAPPAPVSSPSVPVGGGGGGSAPTGRSVDAVSGPIDAPRGGTRGGGERAALAVVPHSEPYEMPSINSLEDVVQILEMEDEVLLSSQVYQFAHLVKLEEGLIELRPEDEALPKFTQDLGSALTRITGTRWMVSVSGAPGQPTLAEKAAAAAIAEREEVLNMPIMKEVLSVFPEAELVSINFVNDSEEG
jgi:DNA polymerase-3 subunit gamma/tau